MCTGLRKRSFTTLTQTHLNKQKHQPKQPGAGGAGAAAVARGDIRTSSSLALELWAARLHLETSTGISTRVLHNISMGL